VNQRGYSLTETEEREIGNEELRKKDGKIRGRRRQINKYKKKRVKIKKL